MWVITKLPTFFRGISLRQAGIQNILSIIGLCINVLMVIKSNLLTNGLSNMTPTNDGLINKIVIGSNNIRYIEIIV